MQNEFNLQNSLDMLSMLNNMNYNNEIMKKNIVMEIIKNEFQNCQKDDDLLQIGCTFRLKDNDIFNWKVTMYGPKETPYENGIFTINILFPNDYPLHGAEFRFMNKIYHLNVDMRNNDSLGHISLNNINEWRITGKCTSIPNYGVKKALFDIFCLFFEQGADSPYEEEMANDYVKNRDKFNENAKKWTLQYATKPL
jgi:ubiquitin-conjugating enzyme E2 D/E